MKNLFVYEGRYIWLFNIIGIVTLTYSVLQSFPVHMWLWSYFIFFIIMGGGLSAAFHRLIVHRCSKVPKIWEYILAYFGCLGLTGSPVTWGHFHIIHHRYSDTDKDPTIPPNSLFNLIKIGNFVLPLYETHNRKVILDNMKESLIASRHILKDKFYTFIHQYYYLVCLSWVVICFMLGGISGVLFFALIPAFFSRLAITLTNNLQHNFGYQNFNTGEKSRNNVFLFPLMFGENWHNNHHQYPLKSNCREKWWELDLVYLIFIRPFND